jgi:NADH-quinone oxidoreductase subunit E
VPRGKHKVKVCCGTACHLGGGALNIEQITRELDLDENGNTGDMLFTVETVNWTTTMP